MLTVGAVCFYTYFYREWIENNALDTKFHKVYWVKWLACKLSKRSRFLSNLWNLQMLKSVLLKIWSVYKDVQKMISLLFVDSSLLLQFSKYCCILCLKCCCCPVSVAFLRFNRLFQIWSDCRLWSIGCW